MAQPAFDQTWASAAGRTETVATAIGPIRVRRAGAGRPLACIHGWAMGGAAFARQLSLVEAGFEIVAPDLPGFAGAPSQGPTSIARMADAVDALVRALALDAPIGVGWSMGASVLWELLARADQVGRWAGLVTLDMSPRVLNDETWRLGLAGGHDAAATARALASMRADWPAHCAVFLDRIVAEGARDPGLAADLAALAAAADPIAAAQAWESLAAFDARARVARIGAPTLIVHGAASRLYPTSVAFDLAARMARAETAVFDGAGHAPHLERADAFNARLVAFAADACASPARDRPRPAETSVA